MTDHEGDASAGLSRDLPYSFGVEGLQLSAGAGFSYDDRENGFWDPKVGLPAGVQRHRPTEFGSIFWQVSFSTIARARFTQLQIGFDEPGLSLAVAHGASTENEGGEHLGPQATRGLTGEPPGRLARQCGRGVCRD